MDTVRFTYLLKTQLTYLNSVFFTGITGTGKTVIASDFLNTASSMDYDGGVQVLRGNRIAWLPRCCYFCRSGLTMVMN